MDFSPLVAVLEGDFNMDNTSSATDIDTLENLDDSKQISKGKPPRHLSAIQNITSTTTRLQDVDVCNLVMKSPDEKSEFLPIYRSGSCAEQGPKQFMEDEHVCIDDLVDRLGTAVECSSLGAFYGVSVSSNLTQRSIDAAQKPDFFFSCTSTISKVFLLEVFNIVDCDLWQVFDGHGGKDAALFVRKNILRFIVEDSCFPLCVKKAIKSAFLKADYEFADDSSLDISSGTTALTAFIFGRKGHLNSCLSI